MSEKTVEANAEVIGETNATNETNDPTESLVDALFDIGTAWAEYGIGYGKLALQQSAAALSKTADALGKLQERLGAEKHADKAA